MMKRASLSALAVFVVAALFFVTLGVFGTPLPSAHAAAPTASSSSTASSQTADGDGDHAEGSLAVQYAADGVALSGVTFSAYRVAQWDGSQRGWVPTQEFAAYPVSWDITDSSEEGSSSGAGPKSVSHEASSRALAQTLAAYSVRDALHTTDDSNTSASGEALLTGLSSGLYLVTAPQFATGNLTCESSAVLLSVDGADADVTTVVPKAECVAAPRTVSRTVKKVWATDGALDENASQSDTGTSSAAHPSSVRIDLLRNGAISRTVVLSDKNKWTHTWSGLDAAYDWRVAEESVAQGYTVSVDRENTVFTVTNTRRGSLPGSLFPQAGSTGSSPLQSWWSRMAKTGTAVWGIGIVAISGLVLAVILLTVRGVHGRQDRAQQKK
ncbi:MAG: Cna B-type domain-containing protein [Bifidobacteriaceae bacterium]|jgi:hypothetical protein|nr:Cna B-type domain-containing protein [Bifidobacteriaceae bacterium]